MPDNRLTTLNAVHLSDTTKDWAEALNDNFAELDERKTDIGDTSTLVHDGSYVHTDNNFTDTYKAKLDNAEQNVQSDWNQSDSTADDYIKNKPENLVQDASYVHTDNNYTTAEKNKLAGVAAGAEVNVQSDWNESDNTSDAYIANKPTLGTAAAKNFTTSVTQNSGDLVTSGAVFSAIDNLPEPMVFKGTLGSAGGMGAFAVGDTLANGDKIHFDTTKGDELAAYLEGLTYNGDDQYTLILDTNEESYLLAIDLAGYDLSGYMLAALSATSTIGMDVLYATEAGTFGAIPYNQGFNNLDTNGDYILSLNEDKTVGTVNDTTPATWNGVIIGKEGGASATISELPQPSSANEGFTYKVITAGTYAGQTAKVGDVFTSNGTEWVLIPAGDDIEDTWRAINVNGTLVLDSGISGGAVNFKNGDNVTITGSGNDITISAVDTTYGLASAGGVNGLMSSADKGKLDGISAGANKVEASNTNGNIKIDGVETPVYVAPVIDQVTEYSFTAADSRWGALVGDVYTLTIPSAKRPFICYNSNGEQVMATIGYNGTNITVKSDTKFAGKVLAI